MQLYLRGMSLLIYISITFIFYLQIEGYEVLSDSKKQFEQANVSNILNISSTSHFKDTTIEVTTSLPISIPKLSISPDMKDDAWDKKLSLPNKTSPSKEYRNHQLKRDEQVKRNEDFYAFMKKKLHSNGTLRNQLVDIASSTNSYGKKEPEVVSLNGMTDTFMEMLNKAHESESLEDPFHLWSLYNSEKSNKLMSTDSSSFIEIPKTIEKKGKHAATTVFPFGSNKESSNHTTVQPNDPLILGKEPIAYPAQEISDSISYDETITNETNILAVPIYEEIRSALHIDTSIDDVKDDEVGLKITETSDIYLPSFNSSRKNILDPSTDFTRSSYDENVQNKDVNATTANMTHQEGKSQRHIDTSVSVNLSQGSSQANYFPFFAYNNAGSKNESSNRILKASRKHDTAIIGAQAERILEVMNTSVDPCDNFYEYACGKWADLYPLKNKALDNTFDRLREGLDEVLKSLLEAPFFPGDSNSSRLAKTLYNGCMNSEQIEAVGSEPLRTVLQDLGGWPVLDGDAWNGVNFDWIEQMALLRTYNNDILLSEWVAADITNSSRHIIQLDQPDLGLPSREYFLSRRDKQYRDAYLTLMLDACKLLGADPFIAIRDMVHVLDFESKLAKILTPSEERKNLSAVHQKMSVAQLQIQIPEINWKSYLSSVAGEYYENVDEVIIFSMEYIRKLVSLVQKSEKRTVSNYLLWRFVKNRISNLGKEALQAKQEFIQVLFGSKSQPDRWLACVSYVNGNMGHTVGSLFVQKYYPKSSKNDSEEIIRLIRESFAEVIASSEWLEKNTRKIAVEKVEAMVRNVGYPEYILNNTHMDMIYSELEFNEQDHFGNVIKMLQFHAKTTHKLLTRLVDREEWTTTPAVVNAYYSRSKNMIMFPAGLLQPPFYHPAFPKCLNFGGVGVVIGHEISHGFDDRGRQFDLHGNLHQWWTANDVENFYKRATCMLIQYGEYKVPSVNMNINAVNTLSENIADNIGVKIAYKAYQKWKDNNKEESVKIPIANFTYDQLFFLNFGQIWCEVNSPEAILTKLRGGQHSPNRYRVIGTLSNSPEFSEAFNCPLGSPMNPEEKCTVW